jgi:uncharacterized protein
MDTLVLTKDQARNFLLFKQGLIGEYQFQGKEGVFDFIRQAGCIQYDPIDICGKNAELVLQSRVPGFNKTMLDTLLYQDRNLVDYYDKNMSIFAVDDWPYFSRSRTGHQLGGNSFDKVNAVADEVKRIISERKFACSQDLHLKERVDWSWSPTTLSRAALETLYFRGELIIHHKKGAVKYYALAGDFLDAAVLQAPDPHPSDEDFTKWRVMRRIGAVGLLWNKPSDAFLGISGLKGGSRQTVFSALLAEEKIRECAVEGIADKLYLRSEDELLLRTVLTTPAFKKRLEFIAPLDNLLWDRKLIRRVFDFDYKWEIYTPVEQRKYGYYVLPVLYGNLIVGRIEFAVDKKAKRLQVQNLWKEDHFEPDREFNDALEARLFQFAQFNQCNLWIS